MRTNIGVLADQMMEIVADAARALPEIVDDNLQVGMTKAREFAKTTARRHGKHYPSTITKDRYGDEGNAGSATYAGEYGPDRSMMQGGMSFEHGSRNQPPHLDLARSADIVGPRMSEMVNGAVDRWFWGD